MSEEVFPGDGFTLQSFSLGRPLRRSPLFFWVVGAAVIDYLRDAIGVQFSVPGGVPAAVARSRHCRLQGRDPCLFSSRSRSRPSYLAHCSHADVVCWCETRIVPCHVRFKAVPRLIAVNTHARLHHARLHCIMLATPPFARALVRAHLTSPHVAPRP